MEKTQASTDVRTLRQQAREYLGADDPTTRRMLETILAAEEEHADELAGLLQSRIPGEK
jgi:bacterioferritin (cytochrome b1)